MPGSAALAMAAACSCGLTALAPSLSTREHCRGGGHSTFTEQLPRDKQQIRLVNVFEP